MHPIFPAGVAPKLSCKRVTYFSVTARRTCRRWRMWGYVIACTVLVCAGAWAQDAFRVSMAGQQAAEAKKRALENEKFNLALGPLNMRLGAQLSVQATDNVRYTADQDAQSDMIFRPLLNVLSAWRVTERNSLSLSLGVGYDKYIRTSEYDGLYLSPDSDLSFDLYVKDVVINLHSRFSYLQDVTGDPTISGVGRLSRFENTSGVSARWDLNHVVLTAGYDHEIYHPTESQYARYIRASELGLVSAALKVNPALFAGLQLGGGMTAYENQPEADNTQFSIGPFFQVQLNKHTSVRLAGGYVSYFLDSSTTNTAATQFGAYYFDLMFQQQLGKRLSHSLSAGRQLQTGGGYSSATDQYYARYGISWRLFRKTSLTTSFSYQNLSYPDVNQSVVTGETTDYYGLGFTVSQPLTRHLNGSLGYQYYLRDSGDDTTSYTRNQLALTFIYAF
jgi:hypothetical protein